MVKTDFDFTAGGLKKYLIMVLIVAGVLIVMDGFVSVGAGEVGVIFDRGRGVLDDTFDEGLHVKIPFWQIVDIYSIRNREFTMSIFTGEGTKYGNDSIEARSNDGQIVLIDATILYRISREDAPKIKRTLGTEEDYDRIIVRPQSRSVIREVVSNFNALDLVSEKRAEVVNAINVKLKESFIGYGITLEEVVLRNVTYSEEFSNTLEQKQIASENIKIAEFQKQEAQQLKEKKIIEAEAEAEAIRLKGEMLRKNPQIIQLEFVQKMADDLKWGIMPSDAVPFMDLSKMAQ